LKALYVWFLANVDNPVLVGSIEQFRGTGFTFHYHDGWIGKGFPLSGDMQFSGAPFFQDRGNKIGAISDAMPDRWGEAMIKVLHPSSRLSALELLYYTGDKRFGALGFSSQKDVYTPHEIEPLISFEEVQGICDLIEELQSSHRVVSEQLKRLVSSTKSMGGAHPKALLSYQGREWIVKIPYGSNIDTPLIEHASMRLAKRCGINVANTFVIPLTAGHAVAIERFDRLDNGNRLHALSAETVLNKGCLHDYGYGELSYGALADAIRDIGEDPGDREEVFRRMVFNILIDNTDDHEKNHAFVLDGDKWHLSMAYDILPLAAGAGMQQMIVGDFAYESTFRNAISQHSRFGLSRNAAINIWKDISSTVTNWKQYFKECGVMDSDISYLSEFLDSDVQISLMSHLQKS